MKKIFYRILFLALFLLAGYISANAQTEKKDTVQRSFGATKKVAVIVIGKPAKYGYKATKFTANKIAKPIIVKSAPRVGQFVWKNSKSFTKRIFPVIKTLVIKYVKYKLIP